MAAVLARFEPAAADELAEARAAVQWYRDSIKTLSGRDTLAWTRSFITPPRGDRTEDTQVDRQFVLDCGAGRLHLDEVHSCLYSYISTTRRFSHRSIRVFDGQQYRKLTHTHTTWLADSAVPREQPYTLHIGGNGFQFDYLPWHWAGLGNRHSAFPSVAEMLGRETAAYAGKESVDGVICRRFDVVRGSQLWSIWLDPFHDWLPRRQEYRDYDGSVRAAKRLKPRFILSTSRFRRYPDSRSGVQFWFPAEGIVINRVGVQSYELHELAINVPVEGSRFQIDPDDLPDGVRVLEPYRARFTGGRGDLYKQIEAAYDEDMAEMDGIWAETGAVSRDAAAVSGTIPVDLTRNPPRAPGWRPGRSYPWHRIGAALAIVLIAVAAKVYFELRRRRSTEGG